MSGTERSAAEAARSRELLRLLVRLGRGGAVAEREAAIADATLLAAARQQGWIASDNSGASARLTPRGRAFVRRVLSGQETAAAAAGAADAPSPHKTARPAPATAVRADANPVLDPAESPLGWLRRHKDRDGRPLLGDDEFAAGERLRADLHFAGMSPRVTVNWNAAGSGGSPRCAPGAAADLRDEAIAAQSRVRRALAAVGPELAGILIDVCGHLKGLEDVERASAWPQRAGKVVLRVALAALARHYGLDSGGGRERTAGIRHWGAENFRPDIDQWRS